MNTQPSDKTILVVDDDADFLDQQALLLRSAGYRVVTAGGQAPAEALLAQSRPDLAVVDLMMEHADGGFALCHHIKRRYPDVPVILVTAVTSETGLQFDAATREERSWVKADALLAKPVRFEQLRGEVERLLGKVIVMDTLHVLVVDDEPGMRTGVARALRDFSVRLPDVNGEVRFEVTGADSGEAALERIAARRPDILLLDHKLPGLSGLDVLERLCPDAPDTLAAPAADAPDAPPAGQADADGEMLTIMITAYATLPTAISATKRGAYDFLAKPFTPDELRNTIRKAAGRLILARQARRLAAEKRQVRFQFIRVLAHELKAPLAAIEGYLHIVKDRSAGDDPAAYDHMLARSLLRAEGMRKLIGDLLDMTRIESGQKKRDLTELDLCDAARAALELAAPAAAERSITLALHAEAPAALPADRGEIDMLLNNLVSNAVKYNRDGGRVDVTIRAADGEDANGAGGSLVVEVADTGIGLAADELARLFGEFVRIKNEKTRTILGSGLGLSIVRKLAQLYGGDVTVTSTPDVGSTFTVMLKKEVRSQ